MSGSIFDRTDQAGFPDRDSTLEEDVDGGASMVRREERLRTAVQRVPYERVIVRRRIVTEQVTRVVEVRREEIEIQHVPLGGVAEATDMDLTPGEPLELVLSTEEVELTRRIVPRERVRVFVEAVATQQRVSADVRREEIAVEPVGSLQEVQSPGNYHDPRGD